MTDEEYEKLNKFIDILERIHYGMNFLQWDLIRHGLLCQGIDEIILRDVISLMIDLIERRIEGKKMMNTDEYIRTASTLYDLTKRYYNVTENIKYKGNTIPEFPEYFKTSHALIKAYIKYYFMVLKDRDNEYKHYDVLHKFIKDHNAVTDKLKQEYFMNPYFSEYFHASNSLIGELMSFSGKTIIR